MIEKARKLFKEYGALSAPFLMRHLKCTQKKALELVSLIVSDKEKEMKMDHSLSLDEFIETYLYHLNSAKSDMRIKYVQSKVAYK